MKPKTKTARTFTEDLREREAALMELYGALFGHWRECRSARCRRAKACRGERVACFRRWWRALSEEEREARREPIRAAGRNLSSNLTRPPNGRETLLV